MNKQELIEKINISQIASELKDKILNLLEQNELTFDIKEQIKTLIQENIDADTSIPFTPEDYQKINAITNQTSEQLTTIEEELSKDMAFTENELNDLESIINDLNKNLDQTKIDSIRADINS